MRIRVTKNDIKNGNRCDCSACPVALALTRQLKRKAEVGISRWGYPHAAYRRYELPEHIRTFIHRFDNQKPVKPTSFTIQV
jgi:hypothetical protein